MNLAAVSRDLQLPSSSGVFVCVVEVGSFSRAADHLGLTQSGVSKAVSRLEDRLGTRLLHRHSRILRLTEEGIRFFEGVRPAVLDIGQAVEKVKTASALSSGIIRVGVDVPFSHFVLAPNIRAFLERQTQVSVDLIVRPELGDLITDNLDLAIRFGRLTLSGLIARKLSETHVLTCAAPDYLERRGVPASPWDLVAGNHECILLINAETGKPYTWDFVRDEEAVRVDVRGRLTVTDPVSRVAACRSGFGVSQMLEPYANKFLNDGSLVQILPDWAGETWPLFAYLPTRHQTSTRVRAFLDFIIEFTHNGLNQISSW